MALRRIKYLLLLAFLAAGCSDKPPIPENQFADYYVQLQLIDSHYSAQPVVQKAKADSLTRSFHLNDSLVSSQISWYGKDPARWDDFFGKVSSRLDTFRKRYAKPGR